MSELRPPDSGAAGTPDGEGAGAPPDVDQAPTSPATDGASAADATPPPASSAPPPPATPPPGPGETPPPPVDLSAAEVDEAADEGPTSPPLTPPPPPPPGDDDIEEAREAEPAGAKRSWTPVFLVLLALSVGVGGYFGFRGADDDGGTTTTSTTAGAAGEFVTVHDKEAGFTVSYPEGWGELAPASGEQRLLLSAGDQNYFQVKVRPIDPATVENQIVEALSGVRMITDPRQFTLNGVKTYYFLYYTPVTEDSPVEGVHAHYFLINGDQLYTMVFQALPTDQFTKLAPTFDAVAESFQVDNPVSTPATTAGATPSTTAG